MTIKYIPSGDEITEKITKFSEVEELASTFNPVEQNQYKTFIFCNMSKQEKEIVLRKFKHSLYLISGVPIKDIKLTISNFYLPEIGHIKLE